MEVCGVRLFQHKFMPALFAEDGIAFFPAFEVLGFFAFRAFPVIAEDR